MHADQHLRFLITLHLTLIALLIVTELQNRYGWSVLVADGGYVLTLMVIAFAWTTIYGWGGQAHEQ